jgi:hypothetical protein
VIQTGKPLAELIAEDLDEFEVALGERDERTHRPSAYYRRVLFTTRSTLYHLAILDRPPVLRPPRQRQTFAERLSKAGIPPAILPSFVAYVERLRATHAHSTICGAVTHLGFFGRHLAMVDPDIKSLAELDRRRHIETYLTANARATRARRGGPISIEEQRQRIITINCFLNDMATGAGPRRHHAAWCSLRTSPAGRNHCRGTCPSTRTAVSPTRSDARRDRSPLTRCCSPARPASGSASSSTSNLTASTRSPDRQCPASQPGHVRAPNSAPANPCAALRLFGAVAAPPVRNEFWVEWAHADQPSVVLDGLDRVSVRLEPADGERREINPAGMQSHWLVSLCDSSRQAPRRRARPLIARLLISAPGGRARANCFGLVRVTLAIGVESNTSWPCGQDFQPRPECHRRRCARHEARGRGLLVLTAGPARYF